MSGPVTTGPAPAGEPAPGSTPGAAPDPAQRTPGWREVLLVSAAVVLIVLGAAFLTGFLPTDLQRIVFHEPILIGFLVRGTIVVLWGVARRRPPP